MVSCLRRLRPVGKGRMQFAHGHPRFARFRLSGCSDKGSTLIETLLSISLLAIILLAATRGAIGSLSAASIGKERSDATGIMSVAMAQAVALPFAYLQSGLNTSADSLANDSNIVKSGSSYVLELNGNIAPTAASTIPVSNTNSPEPPLVPHVVAVLEGINYTVHTYPTTSTSTPGLVTVVVIVTWKSPTGGKDQVVGEDGIAAP